MKGRAAVIDDSDPAIQVRIFVVTRNGENVIRVPRQIVCEIGSLDLLLLRTGIFERHQQRGAVVEIGGHFGKAIALRIQSSHDVVANFPDGAVVVREQGGLDLFALGRGIFLVRPHQRDFLADILVEEFRGLEEIVFVILLDDAKLFRIVQRAEMNGSRIYRGGDVHEFQAKRAVGKRELANIAHQGDVGVIDGDVQFGLIVQAGGLVASPSAT